MASGGMPDTLQEVVNAFKDKDPFYPTQKLIASVPHLSDAFVKALPKSSKCKTDTGLLQLGESMVFPNKFPFGMNHAVAVMTETYYVAMPDFTVKHIEDCINACKDFQLTAADVSKSSAQAPWWPVIVWNYMPPSAGSIIHPHMQCFFESEPMPQVQGLVDKARAYYQAHKANFFETLCAQEEKDDKVRFLGWWQGKRKENYRVGGQTGKSF